MFFHKNELDKTEAFTRDCWIRIPPRRDIKKDDPDYDEDNLGSDFEAGIGITGTRMISQVMEEAGATGQITKMPRLKSRKKSESEENAEMICEL